MNRTETAHRKPLARVEGTRSSHEHLWAIVLAGGQGTRLSRLTRRLYGEARPKQYAVMIGSRSLLHQTLDRVALAISSERTVVVTLRVHDRYIAAEFAGSPAPRLLAQPEDRGTGAGVLLPAHWISWREPEAVVAVFPSDHFVLEDERFMAHVLEVAAFVERHAEWLVLLGARPTEPETEYGWIESGARLEGSEGVAIYRAHRFWEKPSQEAARACFVRGDLWNTFVFVAKVSTLVHAGRQLLPDLHERLARIAAFADTDHERWATQQAYALAPKANFSRSVLEPCPPFLAVSALPTLTWSDWGTPERVIQSLRKTGIAAPWLTEAERMAAG